MADDLVADFKTAFRTHPAGIALVTAATATGPVGLTASSVASVALDPTSLVFSVTRATGTAGALLGAPSLVVHFLGIQHEELARSFATSGGPRFTADQPWLRLPTGEPYLPDARAALRAIPTHMLPVGSSTLVVAEVVEVRLGPPAPALVWHDLGFHAVGGDAAGPAAPTQPG
ncbi:flavin reductase family protein [Agromyces larvae]|uniref:Flavin reductase family protein n=1 Tax=Agromyces larvae TaxID=2929802 RepID=A0ABY4C431_9MICO|nr:flavin reductase family protein [Agromyces larvae]UOE44831.1 flavin reductase family protein [Agromyces larvae]